ncbi:MAG: zf-HC2 domain-containing protein [Actinomyces sp.]|nr:MAG: zf-HC2 domain-containing protein [Actinomyces sp.]
MRIPGRRRQGPASCREVGRVLQSYLDGVVDDTTARRVAEHLEECRRCGLEYETYHTIKQALARRRDRVDPDALARLRDFGRHLLEDGA